jgi:hypothetical protein
MGFFENLKRKPEPEPKTFSTTLQGCTPQDDDGVMVRFYGFDYECQQWNVGDYVVFKRDDGSSTRYKLTEMKACSDPRDQYFATGEFSPRNLKG